MSKDMGREKLLQELAYLDQAEYINKQAYAQFVKIVEESFNDKHLIPMGNGASQCKYCGASFLPSYTEESPEPVKNTGRHPVSTEPGVDEELLQFIDEWIESLEELLVDPNDKSIVAMKRIKQLLAHLSTSGNDMSDKRVVSLAWVNNVAYEMSAMSLDNAVAYLIDKLNLREIEVVEK